MAAPFGYMNAANIVGVAGLCNNPFFQNPLHSHDQLCANPDNPDRSSFSLHYFVKKSGNIFDATVGPYAGASSLQNYLHSAIDVSTEKTFNRSLYADREWNIKQNSTFTAPNGISEYDIQ